MIGSIISAGANLVGGLLGKKSADKAADQNMLMAQQNIALQKEFAKNGIRWKVEDAKRAGIHPAFAMGASTNSYTPVSFSASGDDSMSTALSRMGTDVSRAVDATRTQPERQSAFNDAVNKLQLQKMGLENDLLASQIAKLNQAGGNPPIPATGPFAVPEASKSEERQPLMIDGSRVATSPGTSPANAWEDQLGDDIMSPGFLPNLIGIIKENTKGMSFTDILRHVDRKTRMFSTPTRKHMRQYGVPENYW